MKNNRQLKPKPEEVGGNHGGASPVINRKNYLLYAIIAVVVISLIFLIFN